ncbi:hypothetical protein GCM10009527_082900 [Actinomadura nitritigenes]|uniref:proton-translocating NAD(P)(+) transhydrogenase n=1 Tax=Actinomadura nitritigenes TaxID=134602 RepID=A0ABS3RCP6_9ACTN|nr:hypothetical protein [Actinomadura nitritigenes]MBO2443822.1 hypothetical protein [Actinomadura nitritigenes]
MQAGARIGTGEEAWSADIVFRVNGPSPGELGKPKDGAALVSTLAPALDPDLVDALAARPITVLAMDAVPRISRAQSRALVHGRHRRPPRGGRGGSIR